MPKRAPIVAPSTRETFVGNRASIKRNTPTAIMAVGSSAIIRSLLILPPERLAPAAPIRHLLLHGIVCYRELEGRCQVLRLGGEDEQVLQALLDDGCEVCGHGVRWRTAERARWPNWSLSARPATAPAGTPPISSVASTSAAARTPGVADASPTSCAIRENRDGSRSGVSFRVFAMLLNTVPAAGLICCLSHVFIWDLISSRACFHCLPRSFPSSSIASCQVSFFPGSMEGTRIFFTC